MKLTVKDKEEVIVSTIISCNNENKKFISSKRLNESLKEKLSFEKTNLYSYNMTQLLGEINPIFENNNYLDSSITINESFNYVKNDHNNYKAYFGKVLNFLNSFEINVQSTLNESLNVDVNLVKQPLQLNINTFKEDLKALIEYLSKQNDFNTIPQECLKIKILTKKPILINGFDICNNLQLKNALQQQFNIDQSKVNGIVFDKSNKQLLFVNSNNYESTICYDVNSDIFDYYNVVNKETNRLPSRKVDDLKILPQLKAMTGINNMIEIYTNFQNTKIEFKDNLYQDNKRNEFNQKLMQSKSSLIK
jgi:hypothetical protein